MRLLAIISLCVFLSTGINQAHGQTHEEIEQMLNGSSTETKTPKKEKAEKVKVVKEKEAKLPKTPKEPKANKEAKVEKEDPPTIEKAATLTEKDKKEGEEMDAPEEVNDEMAGLSFKKKLKVADELFVQGSYYNAANYYRAALQETKKKKKQTYINFQLGESNFGMRDYDRAVSFYSAAKALDKKGKYETTTYQLANSFKHLAQYDTARATYRDFLSLTEKSKKVDYERKRTRLEIKGCEFGDTLVVDEPVYEVVSAGPEVNGPFSDFGPEIIGDELIFSKIESDEAIEITDEMTNAQYARLYSSQNMGNKHTIASVYGDELNENGTYIGNPSFTEDGQTVYYTKCELTKGMNTSCQIYKSEREEDGWSSPIKLNININEPGANSTHPYITSDEAGNPILYFSSDKSRGRGGKDIWYAGTTPDGGFDKAKNAGYPINTSYDEVSPFYEKASQTLYFSSNGHISLGGFDVFKSVKDEDGEWTEEVNMETPINTSLDDYDFVLNREGDLGYIVSNRVGTTSLRSETCCDDIFMVRPAVVDIYVTGLVYAANATSKEVVSNADVVLISENDLEKVVFDGQPFVFKLNKNEAFTLSGKNDDFSLKMVEFNTRGINKSDTIYQDIILTDRTFDDLVIGSIYYEFDLSRLREDAPDTLNKVVAFMKAYPKTIIEVGAHTDSKGSDKYNNALSIKRSEAAMNYLISQKIAEERLVAKGYGESKPAAPNTNENGSDNEAGRALNRRTEFKVIGTLDDKKVEAPQD